MGLANFLAAKPAFIVVGRELRSSPAGGRGEGHRARSDDCKRQFKVAWARVRAGLTEEDIETARRNSEDAARRTSGAACRFRADS